MRCLIYFVGIFFISVMVSCGNSTTKKQQIYIIDTAKSFRISNEWVTPNQLLDYDTATVSADTLRLVTCNKYVYSPFGNIKNESDFRQGLLTSFVVEKRRDIYGEDVIPLHHLHYKSSKLLFYFDSDDHATHSSIYKGIVKDSDVIFENGVRTGMTADSFYKRFFKHFPQKLENKFNVIILESCITGIEHTYTFEQNRLKSVEFTTDYVFNIDY